MLYSSLHRDVFECTSQSQNIALEFSILRSLFSKAVRSSSQCCAQVSYCAAVLLQESLWDLNSPCNRIALGREACPGIFKSCIFHVC